MTTTTHSTIARVGRTIGRHRMIRSGETVLAAVSGGPDSVALLHLLRHWAPRIGFRIAVAHLHHGIRGAEADRDMAFVARLADRLGLPLYASREDVPAYRHRRSLSLETAAREVRERFLQETAAAHGCARIALGHQADDNAEMVLINLLRGSGPLGLAAIPAVRGDRIIRPLIELERTTIEAYLRAERIPFVLDSSNRDPHHLRNRIRHRLLPLLAADYNPAIREALNRLSRVCAAEEQWMEALSAPPAAELLRTRSPGEITLATGELAAHPPALQRRLLRRAIREVKGDLKRIGLGHIDAILEHLHGDAAAWQLHLPGRILVSGRGRRLRVSREAHTLRTPPPALEGPHRDYRYRIDGPGCTLVPEAGLRILIEEVAPPPFEALAATPSGVALMDRARVPFPLVLRPARPGERFHPLGATGRKKVTRFLSDHNIPVAERPCCPVLVQGREIVWVVGRRISETVKLRPESTRALKAQLLLA